MIVYRLEYEDMGVFYYKKGITYTDDSIYESTGCTFMEEKWDGGWRFGCDSLDKLVEYFGSDFARTLAEGAEIVAYEVPQDYVKIGEVEVTFWECEAVKITEL